MFDPISIGLGAIQGLSGLAGILGGDAAKRRAEAARQQAITDMSGQIDADYNNLVRNDRSNLLGATGLGGDAIQSLGRNLGASLAGAGVYNSSATAGALQQAAGATQANLAGLAGQNYANEQNTLNSGRKYITGLKLNLANQQYGEAAGNLNSSRQGLSSFLGSLGQYNIARSGQNQIQKGLGRAAGGYGASGPLDIGAGLNAGAIGGAASSFNPNAFGSVGSGLANLAGPGGYGTPPIVGGGLGNLYQRTMQKQQYGLGGYNANGY